LDDGLFEKIEKSTGDVKGSRGENEANWREGMEWWRGVWEVMSRDGEVWGNEAGRKYWSVKMFDMAESLVFLCENR
jgi:hypothetical protein